MALTVTDNSVRQINAALLSLEKRIGETNSEKAQDKEVVQVELKNVQYQFMAPLHQSGTSVSIDTTGTWQGNANSATTASSASTALNADHATTADTATSATTADSATSADITKTLDTTNGDKLQIGTGAAINVTNAKHAATVDTTSSVTYGSNTPVTSGGVYTALSNKSKIKFVDYRFDGTFSSVYEQIKIPLSSFGSEVTQDNVINFMVIYWTGFQAIANGDWADSSGLACALTCLKTGTGYAKVRCVYFV